MIKKNFTYIQSIAAGLLLVLFGACAKQSKQPKDVEKMSFEELKVAAQEALKKNDYWNGTAYLCRIVEEHADNIDTPRYRLALGDVHFMLGKNTNDDERIKLAYECYRKFCKLNPSDVKAEYASYHAILAKFQQTLRIDCDTTLIEKTAKLCKKHLGHERFARGEFAHDVADILYTCERRLIEKELYVSKVYTREEKYKSARNRITYVRDHYSARHPDLEPQLIYLEAKLDLKEKKRDEAREKVALLAEKYTSSEYTVMAKNLIAPKKNTFERDLLI